MSSPFDSDRRGRRAITEPATPNLDADESTETRLRSGETRLRALENWRLVMTGEADGNGRFGNLRTEVASHRRLIRALGLAALASLAGAAGAIYAAGLKEGGEQREIEYLRAKDAAQDQEIRELRARQSYWIPRPTAPQGDDR